MTLYFAKTVPSMPGDLLRLNILQIYNFYLHLPANKPKMSILYINFNRQLKNTDCRELIYKW